MRKIFSKTGLFICFLIFGFSNRVQASRAVGGELTYTYNPSLNQYEVLVVIYYNCAARAAILNNYTVGYQSLSLDKSGNFTVSKISEELISTSCKGIKNTCEGGKAFGFKKISYKGLFKPDAPAKDWILSWIECNRNAEITTINSPDTECIYLEALLNNQDAPGNSSPQFSASPVSLLCQGEARTINYNVIDNSNNRLVFSLITPKTSKNTTVTYKSGYSASNPLSSNPAMTLLQNGNITLTPTTVGEQTIMAILVQEFDQNNNLVASVIRDAQMIVIDCSNQLSQLTGFNGTTNYGDVSSLACANHQQCFSLIGFDLDAKDKNVYFNFIQPLKNMSISDANDNTKPFVPGGNPSSVGICWTPTTDDIGVKKFLVSVTDSACPIMGTQTFLYTVTVNPGMITYFPFYYKKIKCDTQITLTPTIFGGVPPYTYSWDSGDNTPSITKGPGKYKLTVTDSKGCVDMQTIELDGALKVDFNFDKACPFDTTSFYDTSYADGGITAREWDFGDGTKGIGKYPIHVYSTTGIFQVKLTNTDTAGCKLSLIKPLEICKAARFNIDVLLDTFVIKTPDTSKCHIYTKSKLKLITLDPSYCEEPTSVLWEWGNGRTSSGVNLQNFLYTVSGVYTVTSYIQTKNCPSDTLHRKVTILESPEAFLTSNDYYQRCDTGQNKLVVASVTSTSFAPYNFIWSDNDIVDENATTSGYNISATGFYTVTVTNSLFAKNVMCLESKKSLFSKFTPDDFCTKTNMISMNNETTLTGVSIWGISLSGWDFGDGTTDFSNVYNPSHNYLSDSTFIATLYTTDMAGCKDTVKQTIITYLPYDTLKVISSKLSCFSEKIEFTGPKGKSINYYLWNFGSGEYTFTTAGISIKDDDDAQAGNPPLEIDKRYIISTDNGYYLPKLNGAKAISVEVTYNKTCKKTYSDTVHVFKQFKVDANIEGQHCVGKVLSFTGNVLKTGDYPIKTWWMTLFRDPSYALPFYVDTTKTGLPYNFEGQSFSFTFQEQDFNLLRVRAEDANPYHVCYADTALEASVHNIKTPDFGFTNSCINTQLTNVEPVLNDVYGTQDLLIVDYGDDSVSYFPGGNITQALHHRYADSGTYIVKFKVLDSLYFCVDSLIKLHSIYGLPKVDFSYGLACETHKTYIENNSLPAKRLQPIIKSTWTLEENTIVNKLDTVSYTFGIEGTYVVRLTIEDTVGCKRDTMKQVVINPKPQADFTFDKENAFAFKPIQFTDKSLGGNTSTLISSWLWHFGDGDSSKLQEPTHVYHDVKIFNTKLLVTNQFGCIDDTTYEVDLNPYLILPTAFSPNGDHINDKLLLISKGIKSIDNFKIYNRYGELVFEINDPNFDTSDHNIGWDGNFNGTKQPPGVYQYYITGKSVYGTEMKPLHGNLLLRY